jgi:hypothetical protein
MKRSTQSTIDEAQRWVDELIVGVRQSLTKDGDAKSRPKTIAQSAAIKYRHGWVADFVKEMLETQTWKLNEFNHNLLCELAALALERGELPPKVLCDYAAQVLREGIKNRRGNLIQRNDWIAFALSELRIRGIPLFPHRDRRRPGQTYGCDIVLKAFKNAGIGMTLATVENAWASQASRFVRNAGAAKLCTK